MRSLLYLACSGLLGAAAPAWAAPPPASAFGRIPAVLDAAISPDGQHIAILGGAGEQRVLSIATVDKPDLPMVPLGDVEAISVRWVGNGHVLARVAAWKSMGVRLAYRFERNISITADGKVVGPLLPGDAASSWLLEQPVLGVTSATPPRALVLGLVENMGASGTQDSRMQRKGVDNPFVSALFAVDPTTGRGRIVEKGGYDTSSWEVDRAGEARVRLEFDQISHQFSVQGRAKGSSKWTSIWTGDSYESRRLYYGYSEPDDAIYLADEGQLVRKGLADGAVAPLGAPSATNPVLLWDPYRQTAAAIITAGERQSAQWLDPELGAVHATLARAFKAQDVSLTDWSEDRTRFVVRTTGPASPPAWYLFDKTRKELSPLGEAYPELKGAALGTTTWISYKARDGLDIPSYLTLPPGVAAGAKPPLIVLPHGGPTSRDDFDFDYLAQFLATRGYAVLQPQFRGSWGFGDAFEKAGRGEWGGKMQTDLLDGVDALAKSGRIDPGRVCVVGGSFGGYAALAGAALHPEAYRCAVSIAGISDLSLLLVEEARSYGRESASMGALRDMLGRAPTQKLVETSPAKQVGGVRAPILLIHGDQDTVVPAEQSKLMADTLRAAGKPVEYIVLEGENHYLTRAANRTRTLEALEAFLARNLPAGN